jgi:hypothetical protein
MTNTKPTTIRLSDQDKANAQTIIATGMARDTTSAVQLSLGLVAKRIIRVGGK